MPRKIMLVFFLFISEVCYAQVVVSEFNLSDINRGGMTKVQAENYSLLHLNIKNMIYRWMAFLLTVICRINTEILPIRDIMILALVMIHRLPEQSIIGDCFQ